MTKKVTTMPPITESGLKDVGGCTNINKEVNTGEFRIYIHMITR